MRVFRRGWLAVGAAFAAMLVAVEARAQGSPILPETRTLHAGPVTFYPTMALRDGGLDSNVYNDAFGAKGDFTYSATPRLFMTAPIANTRIIARGLGYLTYYRTYKDQQSVSGLFDARYEVVSPGFRPFVSAGYADRRERRGFEIDARLRQRQTMASVGLDVDLTPITALTTWASRTSTRWDRDADYLNVILADQLDSVKSTVAAGTRFRVTPLTTLVTFAELQQDRFDRFPLRDANGLRIGSTVDFDSTAEVAGHLTAGYRSLTPRDATVADFRGFTASAELRYQFREWTEVEVDADRDLDFSYDERQPYFLETGGRLEVTQRLVGPFGIIAVGERRALQYQRIGESGFSGRHEVTRTIGGGIGIQFRKQVRFELMYERTTRMSSESASRSYERHRVVASATYGQ